METSAFEMCLRLLTFQALVLTLAKSQVVVNTTIWSPEKADISQVPAADKIEVTVTSIVLCASVSAATAISNLFCYDGFICTVITAQDLNGIRNIGGGSTNCFLTGSRCRPPFAEHPSLGCLSFNITKLADFPTSKASCTPGSYLWYPISNGHAEVMRNYLVNERYAAPPGGVCGSSVPLKDGQPGPCTSSALGNFCCNAGGTCGKTTADCTCPTCINYKVQAKAFYIDFEQVDNYTWKYGDGRTLAAEVGVLPWGPQDPKYTGLCGTLWMAPAVNTLYHHADQDCTKSFARICIWDTQ